MLVLLSYSHVYCQNEIEYLGVIKLNDSSLISFGLNIIEKDGEISGHSLTDMGGDHETKSTITGTYSKKDNRLFFKEVGIIYTKSEVPDFDFCFIHFSGRIRDINKIKNLSGAFKGLFSDGTSCIDGEIRMKSVGT